MNRRLFIGHLSIILSIFFLPGCKNQSMKQNVSKFIGQEISIPLNLSALGGRDTLISDYMERSELKLVVWFDSMECVSCQVHRMYAWEDIITYANALRDRFNLFFLFTPTASDIHPLIISLKSSGLNCPVFIDTAGMFSKLNPHIPSDKRLHSFLLDRDNKVVLIGNPIGNEQLWELYKDRIRGLINAKE